MKAVTDSTPQGIVVFPRPERTHYFLMARRAVNAIEFLFSRAPRNAVERNSSATTITDKFPVPRTPWEAAINVPLCPSDSVF